MNNFNEFIKWMKIQQSNTPIDEYVQSGTYELCIAKAIQLQEKRIYGEEELYDEFKSVLEITDMRSNKNPYVTKCVDIAKKYAASQSREAKIIFNGLPCGKGCNCLKIAEFENGGPVHNIPCLKPDDTLQIEKVKQPLPLKEKTEKQLTEQESKIKI